MKTKVRMRNNHQYNAWKKGDEGYIDGYIFDGDDRRSYAVVVLGDGLEICPFGQIEVVGLLNNKTE